MTDDIKNTDTSKHIFISWHVFANDSLDHSEHTTCKYVEMLYLVTVELSIIRIECANFLKQYLFKRMEMKIWKIILPNIEVWKSNRIMVKSLSSGL